VRRTTAGAIIGTTGTATPGKKTALAGKEPGRPIAVKEVGRFPLLTPFSMS
jgi:hypothetical protein